MRGGSQFSYGRSVRAGLAFFTNRSVRAGAAFPPSAKPGNVAMSSATTALPPRSAADASARAGRSLHGRSLHGTRIDEGSADPGTGDMSEGGSRRWGAGAELDSGECAPDPIATPYAERLQSLLKVLELNQVRYPTLCSIMLSSSFENPYLKSATFIIKWFSHSSVSRNAADPAAVSERAMA